MFSARKIPGNSKAISGDIELARGCLREALSALSNLDRLLASRNVGPKSVMDVLPEIREACASIPAHAALVLSAAEQQVEDAQPGADLLAYIQRQVAHLDQSLAEAERRPLKARGRLSLEEAVRSSTTELEAARALVELTHEAAFGETTPVDLADVVNEAFCQQGKGSHPSDAVALVLAPTPETVDLTINPRLATGLLTVTVACVGPRDNLPIRVSIGATSDRACLRLAREPGPGTPFQLTPPRQIEPTIAAARAAARIAHAGVTLKPDEPSAVLCFPR